MVSSSAAWHHTKRCSSEGFHSAQSHSWLLALCHAPRHLAYKGVNNKSTDIQPHCDCLILSLAEEKPTNRKCDLNMKGTQGINCPWQAMALQWPQVY